MNCLHSDIGMEKEMATHSSVLAWRIPGTGESGGLLSLGSHRVGHDWSNLAAAADIRKILWFFMPLSLFWISGEFPSSGNISFPVDTISVLPGVFCFIFSSAAFVQIVFSTWRFFFNQAFCPFFFYPLQGVWINLFFSCLPSSNFELILVTHAKLVSHWCFAKFSFWEKRV